MKKRFPAFLLALAMVLTLSAPTFAADSDFVIQNGVLIKYIGPGSQHNEENTMDHPGGDIIIPDGVTEIGERAFFACTASSITIPDGVTVIGDSAFVYSNVPVINIPNSVTSIGEAAFYQFDLLTTVTIPGSITKIEENTFMSCSNLVSVIISDGTTEISDRAFCYCKSLTCVTIPSSVTAIGEEAFGECDSLTIHGEQGSYAERYAKANGIPFVADSTSQVTSEEYIYDAPDPGEEMTLPVDRLDKVTDPASAASAVKFLTDSMSHEEKQTPTCVDLATLYAENAIAKAASKAVNQNEIVVSAATVADLEKIAVQASQSVESALSNGGVTTVRELAAIHGPNSDLHHRQ